MKKSKTFEIGITGSRAMFCNPLFKTSGEKFSYPVPTYGALKGLVEAVYWKPTLIIEIESLRVMNEIRYLPCMYTITNHNASPSKETGEKPKDLYTYTYLNDVHYQVRFHYRWNPHQKNLGGDRVFGKHDTIMEKSIRQGGRYTPFLGASECPALVFPETFGSGAGFYDDSCKMDFGIMFHSYMWGPEYGHRDLRKGFWHATMEGGVIEFAGPLNCMGIETVRGLSRSEDRQYGQQAG